MKKITAIFSIFMLLSTLLKAQESKVKVQKENHKEIHEERKSLTPEEKASFQTERMTQHLQLTNEQKEKVKQIFFEKEQQKIRDNEEAKDNQPAKAKLAKVRQDRADKQLHQVLSPEQYSKLTEIRREVHTKRKADREERIEKNKTEGTEKNITNQEDEENDF